MIFIALILIVSMSNMLYSQKNKYGKYPADKPIPNIKEYPPAIKRLDSIKSSYYKQIKELQKEGQEFIYSDEFIIIKEFASAYISTFLFYTKVDKSGSMRKYYKEAYPIGLEMANQLYTLPYPWSFLLEKSGVALGEFISDEILPKRVSSSNNVYNYVLKVKIIDDIFKTCDRDTILIRHDHSIINKYKEYSNMRILFTFRPGGTLRKENHVERIYLMGSPTEFMFVDDDGEIYDPNNVLNINGRDYQEFKKELLDFIKQEGIQR